MVRSEAFRKCIPDLKIYESREGQNWQLLLPLAYHLEYGYIDIPLLKYVVHYDSHSHAKRDYYRNIERKNNFMLLIRNTLEKTPGIEIDELDYFIKCSQLKFIKDKIEIALRNFRISDYYKFKSDYLEISEIFPTEYGILNYYFSKIVKRLSRICKG